MPITQLVANDVRYQEGAVPFTALQRDPRFSYCLYVPPGLPRDRPARVLIAVHGTERRAESYREAFIDLAQRWQLIVLAPLFPCGIAGRYDHSSYKFIRYEGIKYDQILWQMLAQVAEDYPILQDQLLMFGFSGGGHFAHRMLWLYPQRFAAVAIGAPGVITLPEPTLSWWRGVADMHSLFARQWQPEQIARVRILLIAGADDLETDEIAIIPDSPLWREDLQQLGSTRVARLQELAASLQRQSIPFELQWLPGVGHDARPLAPAVNHFFHQYLQSCQVSDSD